MKNMNFTAEQKQYVEALLISKRKVELQNKNQEKENQLLKLQVEDQKFEMEYMSQVIAYLKNRQFGRRSDDLDKKYPNLFNYDVFNEAEDEASTDIQEPIDIDTGEPIEVKFTSNGKKKKNLINRLDKLEEKVILHDISEDEKTCENCGDKLEEVFQKTTYKLKYVPARIIKEKHIYPVYKCNTCYSDDETILVKAPYDLAFPKSMADSSLVANVITEKFVKYLPLYRQEKLFKNVGLPISRANLSNWFLAGAEYLKPLFNLMHKDALKLDILHMDETTVQVIENAKFKSYMWGVCTSKHDIPIYLYFYKESREHNNAKVILKDFKGYIQSDGYEAYDKIDNCIDVCCMAHARRKYSDFITMCKGKLELSSSLCLQGLKYINELYSIESNLEKEKASINRIYEVRNTKSKEVLDRYKIWLDETYPTLPPKSNLAKALFYSINNFDNLSNYILDGRLSIDNNRSERQMKNFVIGRKNFMFCFTENGAESSSIAYSIVETAIANNLNVFEYLKYTFDSLATITNNDIQKLRKLLPYSDDLPEYLRVKK